MVKVCKYTTYIIKNKYMYEVNPSLAHHTYISKVTGIPIRDATRVSMGEKLSALDTRRYSEIPPIAVKVPVFSLRNWRVILTSVPK